MNVRLSSDIAVGDTFEETGLYDGTATERMAHSVASEIAPGLQWRKGQLLGEGSFGKVYRGLNTVTGAYLRPAAIVAHPAAA